MAHWHQNYLLLNLKNLRPSKILSDSPHFKLGEQISIGEIGDEYARDFELSGNWDNFYSKKLGPLVCDCDLLPRRAGQKGAKANASTVQKFFHQSLSVKGHGSIYLQRCTVESTSGTITATWLVLSGDSELHIVRPTGYGLGAKVRDKPRRKARNIVSISKPVSQQT